MSRELAQPGDVITVFFAILVGAFDFGQAGPNIQNLVQALGAAGGIYEIIDRVSGLIEYTLVLCDRIHGCGNVNFFGCCRNL